MSKFTEIANKITEIKTNLAETITSKGIETLPRDTFQNMISNISLIKGTSESASDITKAGEYQFPSDVNYFRNVCENNANIFVYVMNNLYCFDKDFSYQWHITNATHFNTAMNRVPDYFYADDEYVYMYTVAKYIKVNIADKTVTYESNTTGASYVSTLTSSTGATVTVKPNSTTGFYVNYKKSGSTSASQTTYNFASTNRGVTISANGQNGYLLKKFKDEDKMFLLAFKNCSSSVLSNIQYYYFSDMSTFTQGTTMYYADPFTWNTPTKVYNVYELGDNNIAIVSDGYITIKTINPFVIVPASAYNIQLPIEHYKYSSDVVVTPNGYIYAFDINNKLTRYKIKDEIVNLTLA